jgi:signal transduction histidine kinase
VDVEDTNPAIDRSEIDDLLKDPGQTEKHADSSPRGAGFGLAVAKEFVELHGGRLWAESRPEGGVIYSFEIPQYTDASATAQAVFSGASTESEGYE